MISSIKGLFKPDGKNSIHDGIEHDPGGGKALLDTTDAALLLLDHQSGLFQNVKDISITELRTNTTALAKLASMHNIPVITTASVPDGPNGPSGCHRDAGSGSRRPSSSYQYRWPAPTPGTKAE